MIQLLLIEPGVYWRVFDLDYQAEQFAVYHRSALTRWTHYLGTPALLACAFALAAPYSVGPVPAAAALWLALAGWYLALNPVVGLAAGVYAGAVAWIGTGLDPGAAAVGLGASALALNLSHSVEPVPPALTGRGFEPFPLFWSRATGVERARVLALNAFYLPMEIVSAPRLLPVHALRALHALGWRADWAGDVERRAASLLTP